VSLRDSGLVRENRAANGGLRWSVSNGQRSLETTSTKPQNAQDLERLRAVAVKQLEEMMMANNVAIGDLIPSPADSRGVNLR
jgi:hypothetical protein